MIQIQNLSFRYGVDPVFHNVNAQVSSGSLCGLFGPNGCGKTTLFKCCMKFLTPKQGEIHLDGKSTTAIKPEKFAKLAAYVPQSHEPPFPFFVREIVLMGRTPHLGGGLVHGGFAISQKDKAIAEEAMERVGVLSLAGAHYNELSGGQRQLVIIARAIAQDTPILFFDEPTAALDYHNQLMIWETMRSLSADGKTILVCTHDPNHILWFCDHALMMSDGEIFASGTPRDCFTDQNLARLYQQTCRCAQMGEIEMIVPARLYAQQENYEVRRDEV